MNVRHSGNRSVLRCLLLRLSTRPAGSFTLQRHNAPSPHRHKRNECRRRKKKKRKRNNNNNNNDTHTHAADKWELSGPKTRQLVFRTVRRSPAHTYTHGVLYSASWLSAILISTSLQPKFHIARIVLVSFPSTTPANPIPGHSFSATHPPNRKSVPTYWTNFRLHGRIAQTMCQCCHSYYRSKQVTKSNKNRFRIPLLNQTRTNNSVKT